MEALVRWQHPERGLVSPADFIPVAEDSGLIIPLGKWVLDQACIQNRTWQDHGYAPFYVSVNISSVQFRREDIVATVRQALEQSGLEGRWLELEITESLLMNSEDEAIAILNRLRELGVKLSIDDFGTGYSSLSYLKRFPVDKLKIDRSFVSDIESDPNDTAIIKAIVSLGHSLSLRVLAEGVETEIQADVLARNECDEYQGFFFHRPMPSDDLSRLLSRTNGPGPPDVAACPGLAFPSSPHRLAAVAAHQGDSPLTTEGHSPP